MAETRKESDSEFSEEEGNWDWEAGGEFDEVGEDFRDEGEESCKCLFMPVIQPSPQEALEYESDKLGFNFHKIRSELSTYIWNLITLILF